VIVEKDRKNIKVSLAQVAEAAGVSKMTASRVLRGEGGYSEDTRLKVMEKVERLGYLPNRLATVFAGDRYQTVLGLTQHTIEEEENWIRTVLSWQPAGLILTGRSHSTRSVEMLKTAGIPVVEIWDLNSSPMDVSVGINHYDSGFEMGRYLVELGYRSFGYVGRWSAFSTKTTLWPLVDFSTAGKSGWRSHRILESRVGGTCRLRLS